MKSKILKKTIYQASESKRKNQGEKIPKHSFGKWEWTIKGGGKAYIKMFRTTRRHLEGCGRTAEQGVLRKCACSCLQHEPLPMGENMLAESDVARFNSGPRTDLSKFGLAKTYPRPTLNSLRFCERAALHHRKAILAVKACAKMQVCDDLNRHQESDRTTSTSSFQNYPGDKNVVLLIRVLVSSSFDARNAGLSSEMLLCRSQLAIDAILPVFLHTRYELGTNF